MFEEMREEAAKIIPESINGYEVGGYCNVFYGEPPILEVHLSVRKDKYNVFNYRFFLEKNL